MEKEKTVGIEKRVTKAGRRKNSELQSRLWFGVSACIVCLIIAWTCWPLFSNPQVEPDDYRYLHNIQLLDENFKENWIDASVVENRWDHLWWVDMDKKVRFFRPTVVLSYWLDVRLWGERVELGLLVTNILIHLLCTLFVSYILFRWIGPGIPALSGSALFAAFYCHGEVLYYIAGRTDSLAALGFLAGFALHISGCDRKVCQWLALPCFAFAFITKELTVSFPLVCLLYDLLVARKGAGFKSIVRKQWRLYLFYALVAISIQVVRQIIVHDSDMGMVRPYLISPLDPEFYSHLYMQIRNYSENLSVAMMTKPFMQFHELGDYASFTGVLLALSGLGTAVFLLAKNQYFVIALSIAVLTWLPTSFVYISERYLYLPSAAVALVLGLVLDRLRLKKEIFVGALLIALTWTGHQAYKLAGKHEIASKPAIMQIMKQQLSHLVEPIPKGSRLLLVNLPSGGAVQSQFTECQLRVQLDDPSLTADVLTVMPFKGAMGSQIEMISEGENTLVLRGRLRPNSYSRYPLLYRKEGPFPWISLSTGSQSQCPRILSVDVLEGSEDQCQAIRVELPSPLETYTVLRFYADSDRRLIPWYRKSRGWAEVVRVE